MTKYPWEWAEEDLKQLIGQPESLTLEFKESKLFKAGNNFLKTLSKDISAFANAEGGTIVIGMQKKRGRPKIALNIDEGVAPKTMACEQLQHVIEESIQPKVHGIHCHAIPLSEEPDDRVAYIVSVPKGHTAYQATDHIYYTRNGFTTVPMSDHLVRALMLRGSIARATLEIGNCDILTKDQFDEYRFDLIVTNSGEKTIQDFLLSITISVNDETLQLWAPTMFVDNEDAIRDELKSVESMLEIGEDFDDYKKHEILQGPGIPFQSGETLRCSFRRIMQLLYHVESKPIFPKDQVTFPGGKWLIEAVPHHLPIQHYEPVLRWMLYLDNSPPCSGEINLSESFRQHQELLDAFF